MTAMIAALALVMVACGDSEASQVATTQPAPATTIALEAATTTPPITATTEAPRVDPATALIGVWRVHSGYMTFQEDDTWTYQLLLTLDPSNGGGYAFKDGVLSFLTDVGRCGAVVGIYEVAFLSQDEMAWTEVSDECTGRLNLIQEVESNPGISIQDTIPRHMP